MFRSLLALTLGAALLVSAPASAAPAAVEVKANVHGATTLALALLSLTPAAGSAEAESALVQHVASSGLGEVMGWGQDYYDNVEPAVVNAITTNFQAAFRLMESAFNGTPSFPQLAKAVKQLSGHFEKMRTAVAAPAADAAQQKRQVHVLAGLVAHHLRELPGSPLLESATLKLTVGVRTLKAGTAALEAGLAALPAVAGQVAPQVASLKALAGQSHATVEALVAKALPVAEAIYAATK